MNTQEGDDDLLPQLQEGDPDAFRDLIERHRGRLKRMVRLRLNDRLHGRVDESDIIQETAIQASRSLPDYIKDQQIPPYIWLRRIATRKLVDAHRVHLGAKKRTAELEISIDQKGPQLSSASLAAQTESGLFQLMMIAA